MNWWEPVPEGIICDKCKERPASIWFSGASTIMDVNHGAPVEPYCQRCLIEAQLVYAHEKIRALSERIPALEQQLQELDNAGRAFTDVDFETGAKEQQSQYRDADYDERVRKLIEGNDRMSDALEQAKKEQP